MTPIKRKPKFLNGLFRCTMIPAAALATLMLLTGTAFALTTPFANLGQIAHGLNIDAYQNVQPTSTKIKVAILDNGFRNYAAEIGKTLPAATQYHAGPIAVDPKTEESHGLFMAQLVAGLLARAEGGNVPYELHLFSAFGYSNLEQAVKTVIQDKYDVVLYSQVWEYGGNGDGRGFINALVSQATAAGVLWINASGNFGDSTYQAPIVRAADDWAKLPGPNQSVRVRCLANPNVKTGKSGENSAANTHDDAKCSLRAVLSWNDFKDDVNVGTDKDLDLVLTDDTLNVIQTSGLTQVKSNPQNEPGLSLYPREIIEAQVPPGLYFLRAKIRSDNFTAADRLKFTVSGDLVKLMDVSDPNETLLAPADNGGVVTVGASDSEKSGRSVHYGKPELTFPSAVTLLNGEMYKGSSNSAAIVAAAAILLKTIHPDLHRSTLISLLRNGTPPPKTVDDASEPRPADSSGTDASAGQGLPLSLLEFLPTGPGCFLPTQLPYVAVGSRTLMNMGGIVVASTMGPKIFLPVDPFTYAPPGVFRRAANDMFVVLMDGVTAAPRSEQNQTGTTAIEAVQTPLGASICSQSYQRPAGNPSGAASSPLPLGPQTTQTSQAPLRFAVPYVNPRNN